MRARLAMTILATAVLAALWAPPAQAAKSGEECVQAEPAFGFCDFDALFEPQGGDAPLQAGSHPQEYAVEISVNTELEPDGLNGEEVIPTEEVKDLRIYAPAGFVAAPSAMPTCSAIDFLSGDYYGQGPGQNKSFALTNCPAATAVGRTTIEFGVVGDTATLPVYNLVPAPGTVAKIGFVIEGLVPVTVDLLLSPTPPYNGIAEVSNVSQVRYLFDASTTLWGVPADESHDGERHACLFDGGKCPVAVDEQPFITLPTRCEGPLENSAEADSWQHPGDWVAAPTALSHDEGEPPAPLASSGCAKLDFSPGISAAPTSRAASSPTGLDFSLDVNDPGLTNPTGYAASTIRKAEVTLPEGMSANPSLAEGLAVCTEEQLDAETAFSAPGEGCPDASKIGKVEVESPLIDEQVNGSLYIAKPYENYAENSLLAMYLVLQNAKLGISVKQALEIKPDPVTGQLTTVAEELPQLPFSHFRLHFREGTRSPLSTPSTCGSHAVKAVLHPWSGAKPITTTSAFEIITGPGAGPCPKGGLPPFRPGLIAGTLNNRAGSFSPFSLRMFRSDAEQEITHFSIKLPPGITGKLAGIPYCSDAAIEAAKARTGPHGGREELDSPSCPPASEIGRTLAGAGVGPSLTYAPGKLYLAGPYNGSNLSMVAITAGVVGPFDIGTVVIRQAFKIDPQTAEVFIDSTGSDPIPHIVRGIPVRLRDIRAYVDRPDFVLNPTDCTRTSTASTVLGSGLDFVSEADDNPVTVSSPFQAADCAALPFAPQLSFRLVGGTRRGAHPAFKAHLQMNGIGEAAIQSAQVTLPRSEFIENAHFDTICTRVQFKEGAGNGANCPAGSIYGRAKAVTPILAEPLTGPVFLRSSEHQLPDLVVALHNSQVNFNLIGRVDSVKGQLRNTFETAPDAPVSSFDIELEGGDKGLFVNSTNLCAKKRFAKAEFTGQNGKAYSSKPVLKVKCKKKGKGKAKRHKRHKRIQSQARMPHTADREHKERAK